MNIKKTLTAALLVVSATSNAGVIVGGSTLVDNTEQTQLETWLGQGQLTLTNIFTKTQGSTAADFHAAADWQGATFSLLSASIDNGVTWKTIGGYNPLSWNSSSGYNDSIISNDYSAFIFNLTDSVKKQQTNQYQTYNNINYGPVFGGGFDIFADNSLSYGGTYGFTYGNGYGISIINNGYGGYSPYIIGALEVFTISEFTPLATSVPEPASLYLFGMGLFGWVAARRRKAIFV